MSVLSRKLTAEECSCSSMRPRKLTELAIVEPRYLVL